MKKGSIFHNDGGFTLVEILLVVLLIAILSATGITAFVGSTDTKNSATKQDLAVLRKGIAAQFAITQLRCTNPTVAWPDAAAITANDITSGNTGAGVPAGTCTAAEIPGAIDRQFVTGATLPGNPWGPAKSHTVTPCVAADEASAHAGVPVLSCLPTVGTNCAGAAYAPATDDGWCYDPSTGAIWANSANNGQAALEYTF